MKEMLISPSVKNDRQFFFRFIVATVTVLLVLGSLLWKKNALLEEEQEVFGIVRLTTQLGRGVDRVAFLLEDASRIPDENRRTRLAENLTEEIAKLKEIFRKIEEMRGTGEGLTHRARFADLFFHEDLALDSKFEKYLAKASSLTAKISSGKSIDPDISSFAAVNTITEIDTALDSIRSQGSLLTTAMVRELRNLHILSFGVIALLFVGMGIYIIIPTRKLLASQRLEHDGVFQSLSERNAELALSQENLSIQKRILQSVLDNVGESVVVFKTDETLMLQNTSAQKLFPQTDLGISLSEWKKTAGLSTVENTDSEDIEKTPIQKVLHGETVSPQLMEIKNSLQNNSVYVMVTGHPMTDDKGRRQGAVISFHDVTERVQTEIELRRAKAAAEDASRSKSEFLANISHEIRTPMTAVLGYADRLLMPTLTQEDRRQSIQIIRRNVKLLMKLIDDILDVSKIEAGRLDVERSDTSLQEAISEVYSLLYSRAQEKGVTLNVKFEGKVPTKLHTAPIRLRQIMINLLGNAIKFTEKGTVTLTVSYDILWNAEKPTLNFVVADTGCGIPTEVVDKLFSPFVQVDTTTTRRYGGTGLGLVLSKRLALALGGDVRLESSTEGAGSTFIATIDPGPLDETEFTEQMQVRNLLDSPSDMTTIQPNDLHGMKVLVVEDSVENRDLFACYLEAAGADVMKAVDGVDGIEKATSYPFDAIVMDIQMPKMDGYQAVATLREKDYPSPVIALTAHAMGEDRERCKSAGFDEYLTKPVDAKVLVETVKRLAITSRTVDGSPRELSSARLLDKDRILSSPLKVKHILQAFSKKVTGEINEMKEACEKEDWDTLIRLTHRFKGTAGNCGFIELSEKTAQLEDAVLAGQRDSVISVHIQMLETLGELSTQEFRELMPLEE